VSKKKKLGVTVCVGVVCALWTICLWNLLLTQFLRDVSIPLIIVLVLRSSRRGEETRPDPVG